MKYAIKPMWAVYGPGGLVAHFDERSHAEDLARQSAGKSVGSVYLVLCAVTAFVADPPVVRTVAVTGSFAPPPAPEPEDIIDYMEAKAAASTPADGWITWGGGDNPAPGKIVECRLGGGVGCMGPSEKLRWGWELGGSGGDITAFRVVRS
jgi:hypothetical protein